MLFSLNFKYTNYGRTFDACPIQLTTDVENLTTFYLTEITHYAVSFHALSSGIAYKLFATCNYLV